MSVLNDARSVATILAALRFWQRMGLDTGRLEQEIATDSGAFSMMTAAEIDELCETINTTEAEALPVAVVEVKGGMVECIRASVPMRVVVLDADTEGGDSDQISEVFGEEMYVSDHTLTDIDPDFVQCVIEQIEGASA